MPQQSLGALLAEIAGGSRLAMRNLYVRHERRVFRFVMRMVGDRCLAEEVLSEVFFDVWKKADHFQGRSAVSSLAHTPSAPALRYAVGNPIV